MWSNNNAGGGSGGDHRHHRPEKDRPYEVLHYTAGPKAGDPGSNGNRGSDGNKNRFGDVGVGRYRVVEQVRDFG
jgi:hypothetical protein